MATMRVTMTGDKQLRKLLLTLDDEAVQATQAALLKEGNAILKASKLLVPVDRGTLRKSASIQVEVASPQVHVTLGYGGLAAPYALAVHENPRSGQTGGFSPSGTKYRHWAAVGQWKYLETPYKARKPEIHANIVKHFKDWLRRHRRAAG